MNTTYITQLPKLTPKLQQLQLSVEYWQKCYSEAGSQADEAWRMYDEMIDSEKSYFIVDDLYENAAMYEDISLDAWKRWQEAKRRLLELLS